MMKRMIQRMMAAIFTLCSLMTVSAALTSCSSDDGNAKESEITLEDALKEGNIVTLSFNMNGEDYEIAFLRVRDNYMLLDDAMTRADGDASAATPELSKENCDFTMEEDKANNLLRFHVREKKTSDLILTAIFDIKQSTIEVIPGNSKIKVTGVKMKVSNVEITSQLRDKTGNATLAEALVKGSVVEITYKQSGNPPTVFTFVNNGGTFSCKISGFDASNFEGSSLKIDGATLVFSAENWGDSGCDLQIKFNTATNSYRFWTVNHSYYESHTIMVNNTDLTSALTEER